MTESISLPELIEPETLEPLLGHPNVRIIDLCRAETYAKIHIPDAIHVDYAEIVRNEKPVGGLLPRIETINALIQRLGITADTHVVTYDEEGGGNAARMIWTLHACGHRRTSLLNGGIHSWVKENHPISSKASATSASDYTLSVQGDNVIEAEEIMEKLGSEMFTLLDARSAAEYKGETLYSRRGGHIPGAVWFEWTVAMDKDRNLRLKSDAALLDMLRQRGFSEEQEVVVYCQTHHRSALSYFMLIHLGFKNVRAYHGAWSDWGNRSDTPVETGSA